MSAKKPLLFILIAIPLLVAYSNTAQATVTVNGPTESSQVTETNQKSGTILFSDNFNDGNADGWTTSGDGIWYVDNFEYVVELRDETQLKGHSVVGDPAWTDYTYEADVKIQDGWGKDLLFRYIDEDNYYSISLIEVVDFFSFVKVKNGIAEIDMLFEYPQEEFEWHHVKIQVVGGLITVYVNGDKAFTYDDSGSEITHGKIGFQGYTGEGYLLSTRFDNVVVREIGLGYSVFLPIVNK